MPLLHFHVDTHDVGYMPDPDNVATYVAIDDALDDAMTRGEDWIDQITMADDPTIPVRGQSYASKPHTYGDEILAVDGQIKEIQDNLRTNEDFTEQIAREGLLIVLEDGQSVIELTPCSEDACEEYRDEWVT